MSPLLSIPTMEMKETMFQILSKCKAIDTTSYSMLVYLGFGDSFAMITPVSHLYNTFPTLHVSLFSIFKFIYVYYPLHIAQYCIGVVLFIIGNVCQYKTHNILANLRRNGNKSMEIDESLIIKATTKSTLKESSLGRITSLENNRHINIVESENKVIAADNNTDKNRYSIPYGGMFKYVSTPHYFFEIVIYLSFFIILPSNFQVKVVSPDELLHFLSQICSETIQLSNIHTYIDLIHELLAPYLAFSLCTLVYPSIIMIKDIIFIGIYNYIYAILYILLFIINIFPSPLFFCLVWVSSNLIITAQNTHQWYKNKFPNYPADRKSIIPFIL